MNMFHPEGVFTLYPAGVPMDVSAAADLGSYDPMMAVKLAADSIEQLRKCDVFRVLNSTMTGPNLRAVAAFITTHRPDLATEVVECLADIH